MTEAFVTAVGIPPRLDAFCHMVAKNLQRDDGHACYLDLEHLLDPEVEHLYWSAPPWTRPDDLAIFYCTLRSARTVAILRREMPANPTWVEDGTSKENLELRGFFLEGLSRAERLLERFAGRFVAIGRVSSRPGRSRAPHLRDRTFVEISDLVRLAHPLALSALQNSFTVRRAATITRMGARAFADFRRKLSEASLPDWLTEASIGLDALPDDMQGDWRAVASSDLYRPKTEDELRELFVHPVLDEVADPGFPVLHECRCFRGTRGLGIVDSLVRLEGRWIPVESKLRVVSWETIGAQLHRYQTATRAIPSLGPQRGCTFSLTTGGAAIVVDSDGLRILRHGAPLSVIDPPIIRVAQLAATAPGILRQMLVAEIAKATH